jgi:hypothetical protein
MIGQILPNNNERCYSNFSHIFREVNTPKEKESWKDSQVRATNSSNRSERSFFFYLMTSLHIVHLATLNTKCVVHDEERVPWGQTLLSLIDRCSVRASVARCPVRIGREETDKSWPHLMARLPRLSDSDPGIILLDFCISQIRSQCCNYHLSQGKKSRSP